MAGLLASALVIVPLARDAVVFLMAFEIMTLSAFFLITTEDERADARALRVRVVEITGHLLRAELLEQLGVSPLHSALGEQRLGRFPRTAEPLEQKNRFGKFLADARGDVLPRDGRNFVTGVAAEAIHAARQPQIQHLQRRLARLAPFHRGDARVGQAGGGLAPRVAQRHCKVDRRPESALQRRPQAMPAAAAGY